MLVTLFPQTELAAQYKTYLMDHPPLRAVLGDFMQKLLFSKPKDVFQFANEYFTPLLRLKEDSSESSECETSSSCTGSDGDDGEGKEDEELMKSIIELHQKMYPGVGEDVDGPVPVRSTLPPPPPPPSSPPAEEEDAESSQVEQAVVHTEI